MDLSDEYANLSLSINEFIKKLENVDEDQRAEYLSGIQSAFFPKKEVPISRLEAFGMIKVIEKMLDGEFRKIAMFNQIITLNENN